MLQEDKWPLLATQNEFYMSEALLSVYLTLKNLLASLINILSRLLVTSPNKNQQCSNKTSNTFGGVWQLRHPSFCILAMDPWGKMFCRQLQVSRHVERSMFSNLSVWHPWSPSSAPTV